MLERIDQPVTKPILPTVRPKTSLGNQLQLNKDNFTEEDLFIAFKGDSVPLAQDGSNITIDNIQSDFADLEHFVSGTGGPFPSGRPVRNLTPQEIQAQITQIRDLLNNPKNVLQPAVRTLVNDIRTRIAAQENEIQSLEKDLVHVVLGNVGPLPSGRLASTRAALEAQLEKARTMHRFYSNLLGPRGAENVPPPANLDPGITRDNIENITSDLTHLMSGAQGPSPSGRPRLNLTPRQVQAYITAIRLFLNDPRNAPQPAVQNAVNDIRTGIATQQNEIQSLEKDLVHVVSGNVGPLPSGRPASTRAALEAQLEKARTMYRFYSDLLGGTRGAENVPPPANLDPGITRDNIENITSDLTHLMSGAQGPSPSGRARLNLTPRQVQAYITAIRLFLNDPRNAPQPAAQNAVNRIRTEATRSEKLIMSLEQDLEHVMSGAVGPLPSGRPAASRAALLSQLEKAKEMHQFYFSLLGFQRAAIVPPPANLDPGITRDNIENITSDLMHFMSGAQGPSPTGRPRLNLTPEQVQAYSTAIRQFLINPGNAKLPEVQRTLAQIRAATASTERLITSSEEDIEFILAGNAGPLPSGRPRATHLELRIRADNAKHLYGLYRNLIRP